MDDSATVRAVQHAERDWLLPFLYPRGLQRSIRHGVLQRPGTRGAYWVRWRRFRKDGGAECAGRVAGEQLDHGLADMVQDTEPLKDFGPDALALADQPEQDVLGPDVVVAQLHRLAESQLEDFLGTRCKGDVTGHGRLASSDDLRDLLTHGNERDIQRLERGRGETLTFVDQAQEEVLGPDVVVVQHPRLCLGELHDATRSIGESLEQTITSDSMLVTQRPGVLGGEVETWESEETCERCGATWERGDG
jgi:hypothetical protein